MSAEKFRAGDPLTTVTRAGRSNSTTAGETLSPSSASRHQERRDKRDLYFLKGPLPFAWIRGNIPDPTSRVVLVAQAFMDMGRSGECVLTAKVWDCAGVSDRYQRRRILARLRKAGGDLEVGDRTGRPSVLRMRRRSPLAAG